jgi:hypothetical protein
MNTRGVAQPAERIEPRVAPAPARPAVARGLTPATVLALQRTSGNAAVSSLMRSHAHAETQPPADVRVVERMPTIPEPGVKYVIGKPGKRYTFDVAYANGTMHFPNMTSPEAIEKLRQIWRMLHEDLKHGRGENLEVQEYREDNVTFGYWADLRGRTHVPDPEMWNAVGGGTLLEVWNLLKVSDDALKADDARAEAVRDESRSTDFKSIPGVKDHLEFDPTEERIRRAGALLEKAGRELNECQRILNAYRRDTARGAELMIRDVKITIGVLTAAAGGVGAGFAPEGAGLLTQAAYGAAGMGAVGAFEETASQAGEMYFGLRDHFDVKALGKRVTRDVVLGFVGGVIGGKFSQVVKGRLTPWLRGLSEAQIAATGLTREELLHDGERFLIEWLAGSVASSPFTTTAGHLLDRALDGKFTVHTWGEFADSVLHQMISDGAMGAFLTHVGLAGAKHGRVEPAVEHPPAREPAPAASASHPRPPARSNPEYAQRPPGRRPSTGHPKPPKPPVIVESPPGGFEPTAKAPEDSGPMPEPEEIILDEATPLQEPRNPGTSPERKFHKTVSEVQKAVRDALQKLFARGRAELGGRPRKIDALVAEVAKTDAEFAAQIKEYYEAIDDPGWVEEQMLHLWEQARDNVDTTAGELLRALGADERGINEFWNSKTIPKEWIEEFRQSMADPRVFIDMPLAGDTHSAHIHAFHEYLGDRLFGKGKGRVFRQKLANLKGKGTIERAGQGDEYEKPLWAHVWNELFDADPEGGLHWPEGLGKILQDHLDFPVWDPGQRPQ